MLGSLKLFFDTLRTGGAEEASKSDGTTDAVATLLAKAASLDGEFGEAERKTIETLLAQRFSLTQEEVRDLIDESLKEMEQSVDFYSFTKVIRDEFDHEKRVELMEMLWEVAYADGVLHDYEASLMRRVTGLIYVTDQESGAARKRVMQKLGLAE
ncbi:TerB family tellurite resistance protein [Nisaea acidiphila]|uniref:TerB family tellurite resistance protein n=1 Tax=Nisaea acidiphila TaxID=1862145 RepID=A0A9J7AV01_9PROT|nr:TerB family tellurite resistance protein [Nisaea acidiphila]UUX51159.1 TerB family tellurite resistance protein [Nisaea acidiphila]